MFSKALELSHLTCTVFFVFFPLIFVLVLHNKSRLLSISFLSCVSIAQLRGTAGMHTVVAFPSTCQIRGMKNLQSSNQYLEQTDKHPFNERSLFQVKPIWFVTKQEMTRWQWHQLDHMQIICISLQTDNHAGTSSIFTGWMLFLTPI